MGTAQWPQEIMVKPIEEIVTNICSKPATLDRKARAQKEQALNCPRCNSTSTKFCYYNNYSLTQPRYFCKACRRYWTAGGSLRNIPVGGGSRKNKRSSSPYSSCSSSKNPKIHGGSQDFNLAFPASPGCRSNISELVQVPNGVENNQNSQLSALELLTGISSRGLNSFIPMPVSDPNTVCASGFSMQAFKQSLNFSLGGLGSGYGSLQGVQETTTTGRLLFPFEDLKQVSTTTHDIEQHKEQGHSAGYWSGSLGEGSW